ncbi:hypothetical protein BC939DRAFT_332927 [Gamsiella multidivaricata]|uniref:uncharacterized protein n=1 Tax=Gamsiella multidivaricata TaxID=101098 RepID=UPI002220A8DC|nr:uncharacterized protein BC939DRAFT_332927 [Gamsiella multidivaricata]KAI7817298.1 hypothetical protein BC939DRAFT_332927 [Gamsiella multidivaricata]
MSEEDKSATLYECLEANCAVANINLQDAVAELFAQYAQGGLYWMEPSIYAYSQPSLDFQYPPATVASRAIPIIRPLDDPQQGRTGTNNGTKLLNVDNMARDPDSWARIDDDDDDTQAKTSASNGHQLRDALDPFDDDEFNPFAPPSASDLEVLNGTRNIPYGSYHSATDLQPQYPPPVFYSSDESYGGGALDDGSVSYLTNLDQDMTPLEMLVQIIKDVSPDKIEKAFARSGYDFERTLETLMAARASGGGELAMPFMGDIRSTQTCRHFLQGNCFRKDCWYSHDLDLMVCKFWLKGQCLKGETCEFNHFIDTSRVTETPPPPVKQQPPTMDDFDFPSLSASTASSKNKGSAKVNKGNGQSDSKKNKNNKNSNGNGESSSVAVDALATQLEEKAKVSSPPLAKPTISYSATAAAAASKPLTPLQRADDAEEQRRAFKLEMAPSSIPWLETGSTLNNEYLKSRAQAIEYGKARNRCFELATQAYLRNDGATAAKLSFQGREYNDLMMATHREASRQIFNSRNQEMIKSTAKGETWIDLHGLHVDESLAFLDEFMEKLEKEVYTGTVYVVTGTGNHSSNSRAKVKPAIIDWLESWDYVWKEMSLDKVHGGVLAVQVIKGKSLMRK